MILDGEHVRNTLVKAILIINKIRVTSYLS